jgi:hypothetical protein
VAEPGEAEARRQFVVAGLDLLELEAGEAELAVIEAVDALYGEPLQRLLEAKLDGVEPEPGADLSRAPRALEQR